MLSAAAAAFRAAIAFGAGERAEWAHLGLGQVLLEQGDAAAAAEMLATAVASAPTDALALSTLAGALRRVERLDEATLVAAAVTEADPTSGIAYNNLGLLLAEAERHEDAINAFAAGIRLDARNAELLINCGVSIAAMGLEPKACALFVAALEIDPDHARAAELRAFVAAAETSP